jgi:hypothetical protein
VPAPRLQRLLDKTARQATRRDATAASADTAAPAGPAATAASPLQRAETEVLACLLAAPALLAGFDPASAGDVAAETATLLAWAVDGAALGRNQPAELMSYLMTRAAEQPALQTRLGAAFVRAQHLAEPQALLVGLLAGRRRLAGDAQRRVWRQQLQAALAAGDQTRAVELQSHLLQRLREDLPRHQPD